MSQKNECYGARLGVSRCGSGGGDGGGDDGEMGP